MRKNKFLTWIAALVAVLTMTGCTAASTSGVVGASVIEPLSGVPDAAFARAYEPIPLTFPLDHGAHPDYQTEWWYYTGNLVADDGREFGYQFTLFRSALTPETVERPSAWGANQVYMVHFALTDVAGREHYSFERYSRGADELAGAVGEPLYAAWLEDWSVRESEPGVSRMQASQPVENGVVALDLTLRETRPPLLHGDAGLSQKGPEPGNASYYYSLVGLETAGSVTVGEQTIQVTGQSWMDHEFGTAAMAANAVGWDWFSVQLDDGSAVMFAQIRTEDGADMPEFEGTLLDAAGNQTVLASTELTLEPTGEWTSPRTGIVYPSGWEVRAPAHDLDLTIEPLIADQEMAVSFIYWEGAVRAEGTLAGRPVSGRGYVELTGYGPLSSTEFQR